MDTNRNEDMEMRADAQRQPAANCPMDDMPADALIIVPVRNMVLFPGLIAPLAVARPTSIAAAQEAVRSERRIGVLLQRNPDTEDPREIDLYSVGTVATVLRYVTAPTATISS
jgi:ATP-dependent Lon protease